MKGDDYDLAVVGGGIAGLTLAYFAAHGGWRTVVFEARARLGGAVHTMRPSRGVWLELGAHTLFNSYPTVLEVMDAFDLPPRLLARRRLPYRIWRDHSARPLWSQLNWGELLMMPLRVRHLNRREQTLSDYFGALAGPRNYEAVAGPALDAVICQPARDVPADLIFQRKPRRSGVPRSFSLMGGLSTLVDALAADLQPRVDTRITAVERHGAQFRLLSDSGQWFARRIGLAVPSQEAARLLGSVRADASRVLAGIATARVESLGVVVSDDHLELPPVAGLIGQGQPFYSVVSRDPIPSDGWRGFTFHFRPGALAPHEKLAAAARVLGITPDQFSVTAEEEHVLPSPRLGHGEQIAKLDAILAREPIALTGNYLHGLSLETCAARSLREWERLARR